MPIETSTVVTTQKLPVVVQFSRDELRFAFEALQETSTVPIGRLAISLIAAEFFTGEPAALTFLDVPSSTVGVQLKGKQ